MIRRGKPGAAGDVWILLARHPGQNIRTPSVPESVVMTCDSSRSRQVFLAVCAAITVMSVPVWAADDAAADAGESAVWAPKELNFTYMGFTTKYSCDGLRDALKGVLLDLGARKKDLKVIETGCSSSSGRPDPFPGVRIRMMVLQPAATTAGAGHDAGKDGGKDAVTATWKPVDLKLRNSLTTESGDCELFEQIRHSVVPLFSTRNVDSQTTCVPHQASASRPVLKLEVLAVPQEDKTVNAKAASPGG